MLMKNKFSESCCLVMMGTMLSITNVIGQEVIEPHSTVIKKDVVVMNDIKSDDRFNTTAYKGKLYFGVGIGMLKVNATNSSQGASATLYGGYSLSEFASLEARYTTLLSDIDSNGIVSNIAVRNLAVYIKQKLPTSDTFTPYGLLGYGVSYYGDDNDDSLQWGLGFNYAFDTNTAIYFDYISFYNDTFNESFSENIELSSYSFGTTFTF